MSPTLAATAAIATTWLVLAALAVGLGRVWHRSLGVRDVDGRAVIVELWAGLALLVLWAEICHFRFPLGGGWALLPATAVAAFGLGRDARPLLGLLGRAIRRAPYAVALFVVLSAWLAYRATGPCTWYDSAMYHLHLVSWSQSHAIVPGLANLQPGFGNNNCGLLLAALLEVGPWVGRSQHLVGGFLASGLALFGVIGLRDVARGDRSAGALFDSYLLVAAMIWSLDSTAFQIASLSTDLQQTAVGLAAASIAIRILTDQRGGDARRIDAALLLATATALKISAAAFAGTAWLVVIIAGRPRVRARGLTLCVLVPAVVLTIWMTRGLLLSGYPIFPNTVGGLDREWTVPVEQAQATAAAIHAVGRGLVWDIPTAGWPWLRGLITLRWSQNNVNAVALPLALGLAGLALCLLARRSLAKKLADARPAFRLVPPALVSIALWLVLAPQPRHGALAALVLAGLGLIALARLLAWRRLTSVAVIVGLAALPFLSRWLDGTRRGADPSAMARQILLHGQGSDRGLHALPRPHLVERTTRSGLRLLVTHGLQPDGRDDDRLWRAPLLATPRSDFNPNLRQRDPADLGAGFSSR